MNQAEASGTGGVAIGGDAWGNLINTGTLILTLPQRTQADFQYLSDAYRQAQKAGQPYVDFYEGVEANWVTIAHGLDAPRKRMEALLDFARDPQPRAIGLLLGRAGEGKSTLLRRLAWELAEAGYPVFWYETYRHQDPVEGGAEVLQALEREHDRPLVFCFDDADQLDEILPDFVRMLNARNLRYRLFGAARFHQWQHARLTLPLSPQTFELKAMERAEVEALLERMEAHGGLGALAELTPRERLRRFLATMEHEELQLLPAMIAVRRRKAHFEQIIRDVLAQVERWEEGERLLHAYAALAAVHRFGYWLEIELLAATMTALDYPMRAGQVRPLILDRLKGELLDIREGRERRLYTRHAIIAERVFRLLDEGGWLKWEGAAIYEVLFRELENYLVRYPRSQSRKLFTMLPLALREAGEAELARTLLRQATELTPGNPVPFQVLALMEKEAGHVEEARDLFRKGVRADPSHAPLWQAWALMEWKEGEGAEATLTLCERALRHLRRRRDRADLLVVKARVLAALGRDEEAETAFREALGLDRRNPHNHWHFANFLAARHRYAEANEHRCAILELQRAPRWMREKAQRYCKRRR